MTGDRAAAQIEQAKKLLETGEVIGLPTETVYGLAGQINRPQAIQSIFRLKKRPFFDPLIVHIGSVQQAKSLFRTWTEAHEILAKNFWPGPLTLVNQKTDLVSEMITSGLSTVGVRMPSHPMALALLQSLDVPLAAPSANLFGRTSPTTAEHVRGEIPNVFVMDGGTCEVGIESTILLIESGSGGAGLSGSQTHLEILRKGMISQKQIEEVLKKNKIEFVFDLKTSPMMAPGKMKHHYMPNKPLIIWRGQKARDSELTRQIQKHFDELPDEVEGVKILKPAKLESRAEIVLNPQPELAARELYSELRSKANLPVDFLLFHEQAIHAGPDWAGIMDRLQKAASLILPLDNLSAKP